MFSGNGDPIFLAWLHSLKFWAVLRLQERVGLIWTAGFSQMRDVPIAGRCAGESLAIPKGTGPLFEQGQRRGHVEHLNINSENRHFSNELWADFVRGLGDEAARKEIQSHLDSGCAECQASHRWLEAIVRFAVAERQSEVPDALERQAHLIHGVPSRPRWIETWETITAQLIQQAALAWQPAGVRSPGAPA